MHFAGVAAEWGWIAWNANGTALAGLSFSMRVNWTRETRLLALAGGAARPSRDNWLAALRADDAGTINTVADVWFAARARSDG